MASVEFEADGSSIGEDGGFEWFQSAPAKISGMLDRIESAQRTARECNDRTEILLRELDEILKRGAVAPGSSTGREHSSVEEFLSGPSDFRDWRTDPEIEDAGGRDEILTFDFGEDTRDGKRKEVGTRERSNDAFSRKEEPEL